LDRSTGVAVYRLSGACDLARELERDARPEEQRPVARFVGHRESVENSWENEMTTLNVRVSPAPSVMPVSWATRVKYPPPAAAEIGTQSPLMSSGAPSSTAMVVVCAFRKA
jgi:hypothetical protein